MNYIESIEKGLNEKKSHSEIARKIYLTFPTKVLIGDEERQFEILNEISIFFNIPIVNVQVVGSAKTGQSFHKQSVFKEKESDLDIAIIDSNLFLEYTEWVYVKTKGFSNKSNFRPGAFSQYSTYISKGIFRPDLMPSGTKRAGWHKFFGQLSRKHKDLFKSINAGIYLSQTFFELKQEKSIKDFISQKAI